MIYRFNWRALSNTAIQLHSLQPVLGTNGKKKAVRKRGRLRRAQYGVTFLKLRDELL